MKHNTKIAIRAIIFIPIAIAIYPLAVIATTAFFIIPIACLPYVILYTIYPLLGKDLKSDVREAGTCFALSIGLPGLFTYSMIKHGQFYAPDNTSRRTRIRRERRRKPRRNR